LIGIVNFEYSKKQGCSLMSLHLGFRHLGSIGESADSLFFFVCVLSVWLLLGLPHRRRDDELSHIFIHFNDLRWHTRHFRVVGGLRFGGARVIILGRVFFITTALSIDQNHLLVALATCFRLHLDLWRLPFRAPRDTDGDRSVPLRFDVSYLDVLLDRPRWWEAFLG